MATLKQTIKYLMLRYPTLFPNPLDVCIHLFCVNGNGYDWHDGQLVDKYELVKPQAMNYPKPRGPDLHEMDSLYVEQKLKDAAERMQIEFVEKHIDEIADGSPTATYFGTRLGHSSYFTRNITPEYADGLKFPDDIKPDWAEGLYEFYNAWLYALNAEYGVGSSSNRDDRSWWPADVVKGREAIINARARLHPFVYNGQTYDQCVKFVDEMFIDLNLTNKVDKTA